MYKSVVHVAAAYVPGMPRDQENIDLEISFVRRESGHLPLVYRSCEEIEASISHDLFCTSKSRFCEDAHSGSLQILGLLTFPCACSGVRRVS